MYVYGKEKMFFEIGYITRQKVYYSTQTHIWVTAPRSESGIWFNYVSYVFSSWEQFVATRRCYRTQDMQQNLPGKNMKETLNKNLSSDIKKKLDEGLKIMKEIKMIIPVGIISFCWIQKRDWLKYWINLQQGLITIWMDNRERVFRKKRLQNWFIWQG